MTGLFSAGQLVAHLFGDYLLQSHWMATQKTSKKTAAACHVIAYSLPFLMLGASWSALLVIVGTHFVIDHWRLACYVVWLKNFIAPRSAWRPWSECSGTGYPPDTPPWLAVWLLIIADNVIHLVINALALRYL